MNESFMLQAIELAKRGKGYTKTNPCVGAVIVKDGTVLGASWHMKYGGPHAEVGALSDAKEKRFDVKGADLYVTLEPCSTYGKTPPCTKAIIDSGIKRVFIGVLDPNLSHSGHGVKVLRDAGITVSYGVNSTGCAALIDDFCKYLVTGFPYIRLKIAQSLDGKIATAGGQSRWITCEESRQNVHIMRSECDAILVGVGTVLADDPELTVRLPHVEVEQPMRVVLDSTCRIPMNSKLVKGAKGVAPTVVLTTGEAPKDKILQLKDNGVDVIQMCDILSVKNVLTQLGELNIMNLLVEGGSKLFGSFVNQRMIDELNMFMAPMLIGGDNARGSIGGQGALELANAMRLREFDIKKSGVDIWIQSKLTSHGDRAVTLTENYK